MAVQTAGPDLARQGSGRRLIGIDQPAQCWPTVPRLKSYEAAGFAYVQVKLPGRALLRIPELVDAHAGALRERLALTSLRLVLHAPDDLLAGSAEHDTQLRLALRYATLAGAELLVYHGARVPVAHPDRAARLRAEERSLHAALGDMAVAGVRLAIENLAPVYPGPAFVSHDPAAVYDLVARLDSPWAGMCLDLGHAHITAGLAGDVLVDVLAPVLDRVSVFHVHDNFGAVSTAPRPGQVEPVRLDLHLPPGAGSVPWRALASLLHGHPAPLQLEVHPGQRPAPHTLAVMLNELLGTPARKP